MQKSHDAVIILRFYKKRIYKSAGLRKDDYAINRKNELGNKLIKSGTVRCNCTNGRDYWERGTPKTGATMRQRET
jgi:hypothetical protein